MTLFAGLEAVDLLAFHDRNVPAPQPDDGKVPSAPAWTWVAQNHRCNCSLWQHEDQARRRDVPDADIANIKRTIDQFNQQRNDAIERIDETLLTRLQDRAPQADARQHSETAGAIIDRLSILALKIFHMGLATQSVELGIEHVDRCHERRERLLLQRADLATCYDDLLREAAAGRRFWRVYRQFKMYNDPQLNPYLIRRGNDAA